MKKTKYILLLINICFAFSVKAQWTALNSVDTLPLYSIYFVNDSTGFTSSCFNNLSVWSGGANFKTTDAGNTWDTLPLMLGYCKSSIFFVDENIGYSSGTILIKTIDGGITWFYPGPTSGLNSNFVYFINDSVGFINGTIFNLGHVIRKTINGGINWSPSANFNPASVITSVFFTSPQVGFAVGHDSALVLKTTDGGDNWNSVSTMYSLLSVHFPSANVGYAVGFNGTIIRTNDSGNNWNPQIAGTNVNLHSIYCINDNTCYAVGDSGTILKTTDGGNSWVKQNSGTTQGLRSIYCTSNHCYAAGDSGVVLKTIDGEVGINSEQEKKNEIKIYPNPSVNELTIQNNSAQLIQFTLYNSLGEKTINEMLKNKTSMIDLSELANGIYFYDVKSNYIKMASGKIIKQ